MALALGCLVGTARSICLGFGGAPVDWVLASFAGSFLIAVNVVFAKRILMVHVPGVAGYLGLVGVIWVTIGALILNTRREDGYISNVHG